MAPTSTIRYANHENDSLPATSTEKASIPGEQIEDVEAETENLRYEDTDHEPKLHFKTWIALVTMWIYNLVIVLALNSPAAVVGKKVICISFTNISPDLLHWRGTRGAKCSDLGRHRTYTTTVRTCTSDIVRIRRIPSSETYHGWCFSHILHRSSHSTRLARHLQAYWGSDYDLNWFFLRAAWIRNTQ